MCVCVCVCVCVCACASGVLCAPPSGGAGLRGGRAEDRVRGGLRHPLPVQEELPVGRAAEGHLSGQRRMERPSPALSRWDRMKLKDSSAHLQSVCLAVLLLTAAVRSSYSSSVLCFNFLCLFSSLLIVVVVGASLCPARCLLPAQRSRVLIGGEKRWPFDLTDGMVPHGENVTFFCKHPRKLCSLTVGQGCFDGKLQPPECYLGKTDLSLP